MICTVSVTFLSITLLYIPPAKVLGNNVGSIHCIRKRQLQIQLQDMKYATDVQMKGSGKDHSQRSSRSHYLSHDSGEYVHKLRDKGKLVGTVRERGRARRRSSSPSSSQSYSASRSYSSYSSSGSSTSRSHSSSSISPSHSSYSSYTR